MNKILRFSASVILLLLIGFVPLKVALATENITWQKSVEMAIANNNSLKAAIATEKSTQFKQDASRSGFLPQATATLTSNRGTGGNATNPSLSTVQNTITQAYNGSIAVTQNVFSGFQDVGKFNQAKADSMIAASNVIIAKSQVSYDLKSSYQNFAYAKDTVELLDRIIKRRTENLRIIELRHKSGMENKGSVLLAESYLEQAKYDHLQGENLITSARAQLCKAIGLKECDSFDIEGIVPVNEPSLEKIDFQNLIEKTPQHIQALAQEKAADAGITIAESTFYPSVNLTATKGQRGSSLFPQNDFWSFGMNFSVPFFTGGKDYYTTRGAYLTKSATKENLKNVDQQMLVTLQQGYNSYIESISKLKVDQKFQEAAELRADIARNKYNNGLLTFEDWDVIETDLINRQKSYLQSKLNRVVSEATWEQAQGQGVFND